jgi:hypothetical protein
MRRAVVMLSILGLLVVPGAVTAEEEGLTTLRVSAADVAAGSPVPVTGDVTFGPDVFDDVFAQEGSGGQVVPSQFGTDIVGATITSDPARPGDLTFAVQLSEMPPGIGGAPDAVIYSWSMLVDGQPIGGGSGSSLEWRRTNLSGGAASTDPYVRLRTCVTSDTGNTCSAGPQLRGGFFPEDKEIRATVEVGRRGLDAGPGALINAGEISIYHGTGLLWFPGITSDTAFVDDDYRIPSRADSVRLALVPAGAATPTTFPVAVTPSGNGADGSFSTALPSAGLAPGAYEVVSRACWGANCSTTRTPVTLS